MDELDELYQAVILDHYKHPRNWGAPATIDRHADGHNPLCGDRITVYVTVADGIVHDVHVDGAGCAISVASASIMSEALKGKTIAEANALYEKFHRVVTGPAEVNGAAKELGKLAVLAGVRKFPARVKCATLAWHTARAALEQRPEEVSTE